MSAWKKPSRNTCVKKISTPSSASRCRSTPAAFSDSVREIGMPCIRSITNTSLLQKSQNTSGTSSSSVSWKLRRSWLALAASIIRSSSSCRYLSNSATTSRGLSRLPSADTRSIQTATSRISARSLSITGSMPGRSTLTATSRPRYGPAFSVAKCTCAIDALATG